MYKKRRNVNNRIFVILRSAYFNLCFSADKKRTQRWQTDWQNGKPHSILWSPNAVIINIKNLNVNKVSVVHMKHAIPSVLQWFAHQIEELNHFRSSVPFMITILFMCFPIKRGHLSRNRERSSALSNKLNAAWDVLFGIDSIRFGERIVVMISIIVDTSRYSFDQWKHIFNIACCQIKWVMLAFNLVYHALHKHFSVLEIFFCGPRQ